MMVYATLLAGFTNNRTAKGKDRYGKRIMNLLKKCIIKQICKLRVMQSEKLTIWKLRQNKTKLDITKQEKVHWFSKMINPHTLVFVIYFHTKKETKKPPENLLRYECLNVRESTFFRSILLYPDRFSIVSCFSPDDRLHALTIHVTSILLQ